MATAPRKPLPRPPSSARPLALAGYLQKILTARVYDVAVETPLDAAPRALGAPRQPRPAQARGHPAGLQLQAARRLQQDGAALAPTQLRARRHLRVGGQPRAGRRPRRAAARLPGGDRHARRRRRRLKIDAVRALGGEVVLHGDSYSDAYAPRPRAAGSSTGYTFVHPFDDPDVIAGQGTIGMEILRQHQGPIHAVFVAVGGGGLISGVAAYIKAVRPEIKVIGVQTGRLRRDGSARSGRASASQLDDVGLFSDGTAVKLVGEETFRLARELVDDFIVVDTDAVCAAIKDVFEDTRSILEPAGALGVAGDQAIRRSGTACKGETLRGDHLRREHELRPAALRRRARRGRRGARGAVRGDDPRGARQLPALLRARSAHAQRDRVQLPDLRRATMPTSSSASPPPTAANRRASRATFAEHGFADGRPDRRRARQGARPPHGRRPQPARPRRAALPLRLPGAARRADAVPLEHAPGLEHQPVPLPQPGRGLRPHPGRHAGPVGDETALSRIPRFARLPLRRRDRQSGVPAVLCE